MLPPVLKAIRASGHAGITPASERTTNVSMVLAAHETYTTVLAQIGNPTPETPPVADKLLKMVHYFTWFTLLSGVSAVTYGGGRFAWEKWNGGSLESPKMVAGAMIGGATVTSAGTIMNSVIGS